MKSILSFFLFLISLSGFSQYQLKADAESESYSFYYNGKIQDVEIKLVSDWGFLDITSDTGKHFLYYAFDYGEDRKFESIDWVDSYTHPDENYSSYRMMEEGLIVTQSNNKAGLYNLFTGKVIIPHKFDSLMMDEVFGEEAMIFYRNDLINLIPLEFLVGYGFEESWEFYDEMVNVSLAFKYNWDSPNTYLCKVNGKYGVIEYKIVYEESGDITYERNELIKMEMDSIYFDDELDIFIAKSKNLIESFTPYSLSKESLLEPKYSAIIWNEVMGEIVKIPSIEFFKERFPDLVEIQTLENGPVPLLKFIGKYGTGIYYPAKDSLLVPMKYQDIEVISEDWLQLKKDGFYGYSAANYFDYEFTGFEDKIFFIHNQPLESSVFMDGQTATSVILKDTVLLKYKNGNNYYYYPRIYLGKRFPIHKYIDPKDPPVKQQKDLLFNYNKVCLEAERQQFRDEYFNSETFRAFRGSNIAIYKGENKEELDRLETVFKLARDTYQLKIISSYGYYGTPVPYYYSINGTRMFYWKGSEFEFVVNGKGKTYDRVHTSWDGWIALYKKGKGKVYDEKGELRYKLGKSQTLIDVYNDYLLIEDWVEGDTTLTYKLINPEGKVSVEKRFITENGQYSDWTNAVRYMLDFIGVSEYYSLPFIFVGRKEAGYFLLNATHDFTGKKSIDDYFDLNGKNLQIQRVEYESVAGYILTSSTYPREKLYGLHDGFKWIIPPQFEVLEEFVFYDGFQTLNRNFIKVGNKGVYGLYDTNGMEVLPCKYYDIDVRDVSKAFIKFEVIEEGNMEQKVIKIVFDK